MPTARDRARVETTAAIVTAARAQLVEVGAAALSLRAVAREVGMVSSAVYRYFPSRDDLLTTLILEAYDAVGEAAERARHPQDPPREQWRAVWRAVRTWALGHPAEYALVYGSPVPGYAAPSETITAAARVGLVLIGIVVDHGAGVGDRTPAPGLVDPAALAVLPGLEPALAPALVAAWTQLFGTVGFELFGQYEGVLADRAAFLDHVADTAATSVGLSGAAPGGGR